MSWSVLLVQSCTFLAVKLATFLVFRGMWSLDRACEIVCKICRAGTKRL